MDYDFFIPLSEDMANKLDAVKLLIEAHRVFSQTVADDYFSQQTFNAMQDAIIDGGSLDIAYEPYFESDECWNAVKDYLETYLQTPEF